MASKDEKSKSSKKSSKNSSNNTRRNSKHHLSKNNNAHFNNYKKSTAGKILSSTVSQSKNLLAPFFLKRMKLKQRLVVIAVIVVVLFFTTDHWVPYIFSASSSPKKSTNYRTSSRKSKTNDLNAFTHHPMFDKNLNMKSKSPLNSVSPPFNPKLSAAQNQIAQELANFQASQNSQVHELINDPAHPHPALNHPVNYPPQRAMPPEEIWAMANNWIAPREIYPDNSEMDVSLVLRMMATTKIIAADVLSKGTQLKLLFVLTGGQKVVFKPKRFERDYVVSGESWDGFDRHNAEVAGFHLDHILGFRRAPLVVGRIVHFRNEIVKVATERLKRTFKHDLNQKDEKNNPVLCTFGECYYCKPEDLVCPDQNGFLEGTLTLWIEKENYEFLKLRHPYQRTYHIDRKARWQTDERYCELAVKTVAPYNKGPRLLDVTDASVFDYLIGNGDRHHYETFKNFGDEAMLIMIDNAKSFGNASLHDSSILSPLRQCCILRSNTYQKLEKYRENIGNILDASMRLDPIYPVIHESHVQAMNVRIGHIFDVIQGCLDKYAPDVVIVDKWDGLPEDGHDDDNAGDAENQGNN